MLLGLHHVTALAGDPQRNLDFYTRFEGLRLIKRTVNFDDPATHHFYYGAPDAAPGSLLTFFPWVSGRRGVPGTGQISAVALAAPNMAAPNNAPASAIEDPSGIRLDVREGPRVRLHSVTLTVADGPASCDFFETVLGLSRQGSRFEVAPGGGFLDIHEQPGTPRGKMAAGIIHHVAFRVRDEAEQMKWREKLVRSGVRVSLVKERLYFHSIYFREPGGILLEIATDGPGFTLDEPADRLGERLCLPPWLEPVRESIERRLPPVTIPESALARK